MEKLFLTGEPGVGKTTLLGKLQKAHPTRLNGIVAREIRDGEGMRQGFTSGTLENPGRLLIAHKSIESPTRVGSYGIDVDALDLLADQLAAQFSLAQQGNLVLLFDEIGLMQSQSGKLRGQIEMVVYSDVPAIMTVKKDHSMSGWLRDMKQSPEISSISVTRETQDEIFDDLNQYVEESTNR